MSGSYYGFTAGGTQYSGTGNYGAASYQPAPPGTGYTQTAAAPRPQGPSAAAYPVAPAYNTAASAPAQAYAYTAGAASTVGYQQPTYPKQDHSNMVQPSSNYAAYSSTVVNRGPSAAANSSSTGGAWSTGGQMSSYQPPAAQQVTVMATTASDLSTYTGYDAAVYAAAKSYLASKATNSTTEWMSMKKSGGGGGIGGGHVGGTQGSNTGAVYSGSGGSFPRARGGGRGSFPRKGGPGGPGPRGPPRPMEMHYCEICKISCGAGQTYREHLEGKAHKKKEAQQKSGAQPQVNVPKNKQAYVCEICDIVCSGQDTYTSHIRGAKHQKTVKVYYQMGKPLPAQDTTILAQGQPGANKNDPKKVVVVQKLNFVGGEKLTSTGVTRSASADNEDAIADLPVEPDVQPVGEDYLEIIKTDDGRITQYHCKLCDCNFTDLGAKEMHMKGRRHRLNYKKKVNPDLEVDVKISPRMRRVQDDKMRREIMRLRQQDIWSLRAMYQSQNIQPTSLLFMGEYGNRGAMTKGKRDNTDDRYIMAKHSAIYPTDDECKSAQRIVINTEKALKQVSDFFAEKARGEGAIGPEERLLKGVMRVGDLAKQLLLKGDYRLDLVVLCTDKPTVTLLKQVADMLPDYYKNITEEKYEIMNMALTDGAILIKNAMPPSFEVKVVFTSVAVRDEMNNEETSNSKPDPADVLDKQICLDALASLRHAKWFQARSTSLQFCLVILRVLKDLRQRVPTWVALTSWPLELLVEKTLNAHQPPFSVSEGFRRFFEAISSGILMKNGPGLLDPCEKTATDVATYLTGQQREDITASAQQILRLIAFGQIYTVLGMERIYAPPALDSDQSAAAGRKRPRDDDNNGDSESQAESNGKKDKKESLLAGL